MTISQPENRLHSEQRDYVIAYLAMNCLVAMANLDCSVILDHLLFLDSILTTHPLST